jgi:hypothetical protein
MVNMIQQSRFMPCKVLGSGTPGVVVLCGNPTHGVAWAAMIRGEVTSVWRNEQNLTVAGSNLQNLQPRQAEIRPSVANALDVHEADHFFGAACREAVLFAQKLPARQFEVPSAELLALAERAVASCEARKNEDVNEWANRLAQDVSNATD